MRGVQASGHALNRLTAVSSFCRAHTTVCRLAFIFIGLFFLFMDTGHSNVQADKEEVFVTGNWRGNALYGSDGKFRSCTMRALYESGTEIYFAMNDKLKWTLGLNNPKWAMNVGTKRTATLQIDQKPPVTGTMEVISNHGFYILFGKNNKLLQALRSGSALVVYVDDFQAKYELKGTGAALNDLMACASVRANVIKSPLAQVNTQSDRNVDKSNTGSVRTSNNAKTGEDKTISSRTAERRKEIVAKIEQYLKDNGIADYKLLKSNEHPDEDYDVMWSTPNSPLSGIKVIVGFDDQDIDQMAGRIIAQDAGQCEGEFASAKKFAEQSKPNTQRNISTICHETTYSKETHYTLFRRRNGSFVKYAQSMQYTNQSDKNSLSTTLRLIPDQSIIDSLPN